MKEATQTIAINQIRAFFNDVFSLAYFLWAALIDPVLQFVWKHMFIMIFGAILISFIMDFLGMFEAYFNKNKQSKLNNPQAPALSKNSSPKYQNKQKQQGSIFKLILTLQKIISFIIKWIPFLIKSLVLIVFSIFFIVFLKDYNDTEIYYQLNVIVKVAASILAGTLLMLIVLTTQFGLYSQAISQYFKLMTKKRCKKCKKCKQNLHGQQSKLIKSNKSNNFIDSSQPTNQDKHTQYNQNCQYSKIQLFEFWLERRHIIIILVIVVIQLFVHKDSVDLFTDCFSLLWFIYLFHRLKKQHKIEKQYLTVLLLWGLFEAWVSNNFSSLLIQLKQYGNIYFFSEKLILDQKQYSDKLLFLIELITYYNLLHCFLAKRCLVIFSKISFTSIIFYSIMCEKLIYIMRYSYFMFLVGLLFIPFHLSLLQNKMIYKLFAINETQKFQQEQKEQKDTTNLLNLASNFMLGIKSLLRIQEIKCRLTHEEKDKKCKLTIQGQNEKQKKRQKAKVVTRYIRVLFFIFRITLFASFLFSVVIFTENQVVKGFYSFLTGIAFIMMLRQANKDGHNYQFCSRRIFSLYKTIIYIIGFSIVILFSCDYRINMWMNKWIF